MPKTLSNETRERQHAHHETEYATYQNDLHAEINQARRLVRHLGTHADDACAMAALRAMQPRVLERVPHALEMVQGKVRVAGTMH